MAVDITLERYPAGERGGAPEAEAFIKTYNERHGPTEVFLAGSSLVGRWPEVILSNNDVCTKDYGLLKRTPDFFHVRIHGVSVKKLMDILIENAETRRYLETGVDHFRKLPVAA
jgi:hypothetical protein